MHKHSIHMFAGSRQEPVLVATNGQTPLRRPGGTRILEITRPVAAVLS